LPDLEIRTSRGGVHVRVHVRERLAKKRKAKKRKAKSERAKSEKRKAKNDRTLHFNQESLAHLTSSTSQSD